MRPGLSAAQEMEDAAAKKALRHPRLVLRPGWQPGPQLESARARGWAPSCWTGKIYAAGGAGRVNPRDNFEMLDPELNRWLALSPMAEGLERFGIAAAGRAHLGGGRI